MQDKTAKCVETRCGNSTFTITKGEQEFYKQKGMSLPKRCPSCRAERKAQKETQENSPFNEVKEALKERHDRNRRSR